MINETVLAERAERLVEAMCEDEAFFNAIPLPIRARLEELAAALPRRIPDRVYGALPPPKVS